MTPTPSAREPQDHIADAGNMVEPQAIQVLRAHVRRVLTPMRNDGVITTDSTHAFYADILAAYDALAAERDDWRAMRLDNLRGESGDIVREFAALTAERDALAKWKTETEEHARLMLGFGASYAGEPLWSVMGGCNQDYGYQKDRAERAERERDFFATQAAGLAEEKIAAERERDALRGVVDAARAYVRDYDQWHVIRRDQGPEAARAFDDIDVSRRNLCNAVRSLDGEGRG